MGDALFVHGGVTDAQEARLALAGLIAVHGATLLDARTGVMHGAGSTALVTGTTATGPMTVSIAPHQWVTTRGAANGPYLGALAAAQSVTIAAAPGSGTRVDVVYVKQQDATAGVPTPDAVSTPPLYGVLQGTVGAGKPGPLPVGAEELATVAVSAGATKTTDGTVLITNTARQVVARGAPVPCRNQAERDALTTFPNLTVSRLDLGTLEVFSGGTWKTVSFNFAPIQGTLYRFNNQTIGGDLTTPAVIVLNAARAGYSGLLVDGNTGIVTVGTGGEFIVSAALAVAEVGPSRVFASIYVNGVERIRGLDNINRGATSGDPVGSVVSGLLTLNANDQVTLRALHTGASATVTPGEAITYMQLRKVA